MDAIPENHASKHSRAGSDALLLLEELSHRITNEFTAAAYLISFAESNCTSEKEKSVLNNVRCRLQSFARIHKALQIPINDAIVNATAYLRGLCHEIARSRLIPQGIKWVFRATSLKLPSATCWRLGLIVSELVTNSFRHAFHGNRGTIRVHLQCQGTVIICQVKDDGATNSPQSPSGRGCEILRALSRCIDGAIEYEFSAQGSKCTLTIRQDGHATRTLDNGAAPPELDSHTAALGHEQPFE